LYINNISSVYWVNKSYEKIIFLLLFLNFSTLFGQNKEAFSLLFSNTEAFYFNAIIYQGDVLFGSDIGTISFKNRIPFIVDNKIKGPIEQLNGKIEKANIRYDNFYNYLLPSSYKGLETTHLFFDNTLYIICKGDLFVFESGSYNLKSFPSIRSISKNYIGTYGGIFFKDSIKLDFPSFTAGYIREYDSITLLNWRGISLLKNGYQEDYYNIDINVGGIEINDQLFGGAIDSYEIEHPYYFLSTSKGLYKFNTYTKKIILQQKVLEGPYRFIRGEKNTSGLKILYLHNDKQLFEYFVNDNRLEQIINKKRILDVFSNTASEYYILTDNSLEFFNVNIPRKNKVLMTDLVNTNNVRVFKNFILVTSDQGLDLYDLNSKEIAKNVLKDELNYNAIFINEEKIQLGGVNGLYELNYQDLITMFDANKPKIEKSKQDIFPFAIGSIVLLVVTILILTLIRQNRIIKNQRSLESLTTNDKIESFIRLNIQNVSVELICETFDLPVNALYKALGNVKPGEIIRKERLKILKRMRKERASEEEIAKATGFSISYLKKI
jgi:hypothetical protein